MQEEFLEKAKKLSVDKVCFAPAARFADDDEIFTVYPQTKTVIGLAFRVLRGVYRGLEEGSTYYQYSTMGVENLEEVMMPIALVGLSQLLEEYGYTAVPQRLHQTIMREENSTNPEVDYNSIRRGAVQEHQIDFVNAAVQCGIGEQGLSGKILTDEYGPFVRYCFILTDAEFEPTPKYQPHLCDGCRECIKGCPGHAISEDGTVDPWQCATYYNGANGTRNPFFDDTVYQNFDERMEILAGDYKVTPESARVIMDNTYCYPPISHSYQSCICGKSCEVDCYVHLEEKGVLTKKFNTKFRKREKWGFDINDFKKEK